MGEVAQVFVKFFRAWQKNRTLFFWKKYSSSSILWQKESLKAERKFSNTSVGVTTVLTVKLESFFLALPCLATLPNGPDQNHVDRLLI